MIPFAYKPRDELILSTQNRVTLMCEIILQLIEDTKKNENIIIGGKGAMLLKNLEMALENISENSDGVKKVDGLELMFFETIIRAEVNNTILETGNDNLYIPLMNEDKHFIGYIDTLIRYFEKVLRGDRAKYLDKKTKWQMKRARGYWRAFEQWIIEGAR